MHPTLLIALPNGAHIDFSIIYKSIKENYKKSFEVNLVLLPLYKLDTILGMNLLSSHFIFIDYCKKAVKFNCSGEEEFKFVRDGRISFMMSHLKTCKLLEIGHQGFLAQIKAITKKKELLKNAPIVREYT